jgi:hypothetical protein
MKHDGMQPPERDWDMGRRLGLMSADRICCELIVGLHLFCTGVTFRMGEAHVYYSYW